MAADLPPENPVRVGDELVFFLEGQAILPPDGTMPPPRAPGMERLPLPPGTVRGWEYVELDGPAIVPPPGTPAPPRPPGMERLRRVSVAVPATDSQLVDAVTELLQRVQRVLDGGQVSPEDLEAIRRATEALPRAG